MSKKELCGPLVAMLLAVSVMACGVGRDIQKNQPSEENLRPQVNAIWQAKVEKDWKKVYSMLEKEAQGKMSPDQYAASQSHFVANGFRIDKLGVSENGGGFSLVIFNTTLMAMPFEISVRDSWIWEDNAWRLRLPALTPFSAPSHPAEASGRPPQNAESP